MRQHVIMHARVALPHEMSRLFFDIKSQDGTTFNVIHNGKMDPRAGPTLLGILRGRTGLDTILTLPMPCD